MPTMMNLRVVLSLVTIAAVSCAQPARQGAADYFPLSLGDARVYDVAIAGKPTGRVLQTLVSDVLQEGGERVFVVSQLDESVDPQERSDQPLTYRRGQDGVACVECEAVIVPAAPAVGLSWPAGASPESGTNRIVALDATVKTERLSFEQCLVVERTEPERKRRVELVFAPEVGLIRSRFFDLADGAKSGALREELLREFGRVAPPRFLRPPA